MHRARLRTLYQQQIYAQNLTVRMRRPFRIRQSDSFRTEASKNKALTDVAQAEGPPGIVGFGFGEDELVKLRQYFEPVELRVVSGDETCRKGRTVADAAGLLVSDPEGAGKMCLSPVETGEPFRCFSRVVLFCGLPGEVIEGLIEVWPMDLCKSKLISFAYFAQSMVESDLEETLLKIIKASDANEDDESEETSKERLRKMLDDLKTGERERKVSGVNETKGSSTKSGTRTHYNKSKGFGR